MSKYGLKIKGSDGSDYLLSTDRITRLVYNEEVADDESNSVTLPVISGKTPIILSIPTTTTNGFSTYAISHIISVDGDEVLWTPDSFSPVSSEIVVMLYT